MAIFSGLDEEEVPQLAVPEVLEDAAENERPTWQRGPLAILFASHLLDDLSQGAIPALLPFFVQGQHLSYQGAAGLVMAANLPSSLLQPLFGRLADRYRTAWMMPVGMVVAMLGVALATLVHGYAIIFGCLMLSGAGVAAFHPEAARAVHRVSGNRQATGMSIFTLGSATGFAISPILMTGVMVALGYRGTLMLMIPVGVMAALMFRWLGRLTGQTHTHAQTSSLAPEKRPDQWSEFVRLNFVMSARSVLFYGVVTFLPLYWIQYLHQSKVAGGTALSLLLTGGAAGALIGGKWADRHGNRIVVLWGLGLALPLLAALLWMHSATAADVVLVLLGLILFTSFSPMVVMSQGYLPNNIALASGVTMGLATNVGGITAPLLGWAADHWGLHTMLLLLMTIPVPAMLLAATLPRDTPAGARLLRSRKASA